MKITSYQFTVSVNADHVDKAFAVMDEVNKLLAKAAKNKDFPSDVETFMGCLRTVCHRDREKS